MGIVLSRDDSGNIKVTYPCNPVYVRKIKTIPGHKWYPGASAEWGWQYVFPAKALSKDPRTGAVRRHHIHEHSLQKAVSDGSRLAGIDKRVSAYLPSFLCNSPVGGKPRYQYRSGTPGP